MKMATGSRKSFAKMAKKTGLSQISKKAGRISCSQKAKMCSSQITKMCTSQITKMCGKLTLILEIWVKNFKKDCEVVLDAYERCFRASDG